MIEIALFEPKIPPNTGNIIRLCSNMGAKLHLIRPYGFELSEKTLRRAGLDYHHGTTILEYDNWQQFQTVHTTSHIIAVSTKGTKIYTEATYQVGDILLFGSETQGLPEAILTQHTTVTIPMVADSRSINLANSVSIVTYEFWRQTKFIGAQGRT